MLVWFAILLVLPWGGSAGTANNASASKHRERYISVAEFRIHEYANHLSVLIFIVFVFLFKSIYFRIKVVSQLIPESLVLIVIGVIIGCVQRFGLHMKIDDTVWDLTPLVFFDFL